MASFNFFKIQVALFLALTLSFQGCLGAYISGESIVCEDLPVKVCAFAISSSGKRCSIENYTTKDGKSTEYQSCRTSDVVVEGITNWIERDECIRVCGVERISTQIISFHSLLDPQFASELCSPSCYQNCPNIVDLYFNLAAGEGVDLPDFCEVPQTDHRREMQQVTVRAPVGAPTQAPTRAPTRALSPTADN